MSAGGADVVRVGTASVAYGRFGTAWRGASGTNLSRALLRAPFVFDTNNRRLTMITVFREYTAIASAQNASGLGSNSGASGNTLCIIGTAVTTQAKARALLQDSSGAAFFNNVESGGAVAVNDGRWHTVVWTCQIEPSGTSPSTFYIDGVRDGAPTGGVGTPASTTFQWMCVNGVRRTTDLAGGNFEVALFAVMYARLGDAEGMAISRDPFGELFEPIRLPYVLVPGIGVGPTIVRPEANGSAEWTPSAGTNYECVDEAVASDADYVYALEAGLLDSYDVPSFTDPGTNTGFIMRYRVKLAEGSAGVEARLYEGTTLISADPVQRFASGDYEWEVDPDDMATVVDQDNLRPALFSV